jgi:hypothetical protein
MTSRTSKEATEIDERDEIPVVQNKSVSDHLEEGEEKEEEEFENVKLKSEKKKKRKMLKRINIDELKDLREEHRKKREYGMKNGDIQSFSIDSMDWSDIIQKTNPTECKIMTGMFSFEENAVVTIVNQPDRAEVEAFHVYTSIAKMVEEKRRDVDAFYVVTDNIPKSFQEALADPVWGNAARAELQIQSDSKCVVPIHPEAAKKAIREGANVVVLFPIYENKIKNGVLVYKVRLVGNGHPHNINKEDTYAPTPSREEMLMLLHLIAHKEWDYYLVDEIRAFLSARYTGSTRMMARMRGDGRFWEVLGALYGLKTSPKDYNSSLVLRMVEKLGFKSFKLSKCIFFKETERGIIFVYHFVDDFLFTGSCKEELEDFIVKFREIFNTTEPELDPKRVLGIDIFRIRKENIICLSMETKITDICESVGRIVTTSRVRKVPIPVSGVIIDLEELKGEKALSLTVKEAETFMEYVGSVIWISGIRFDIKFAVVYLTWFTKDPRRHHMDIAIYLLQYLWHTRSLVLVLGGKTKMSAMSYCDSSYGKGKNGRSIGANIVKMNEEAGAISGKVSATTSTKLSSFEAKMDSRATGAKALLFADHLAEEFKIQGRSTPTQYNDNLALKQFLEGNGSAKGIRHIELRMFFLRELGEMGKIQFEFKEGKTLQVDGLTKAKSSKEFLKNRMDIMGHGLLKFLKKGSIGSDIGSGSEEKPGSELCSINDGSNSGNGKG